MELLQTKPGGGIDSALDGLSVDHGDTIGIPYPVLEQNKYLVNGELREWHGQRTTIESPMFRGEERPVLLGSVPELSAVEALEIVSAAEKAYDRGLGDWPQASVFDRVQAVMQFAAKMEEVRDEVVQRISWEIGKTTADAEKEFDRTLQYIRDSCDALLQLNAESAIERTISGTSATIERTALGVTLCMAPFNYPLNETFTTLIPALLMGNTTILKPAKIGVLLLEPLQEAFQESFPAGVVNFLYGDGAEVVTPVMQSGKVDTLAFIGSARVADLVANQHPAGHRLTKVLGLGAKNPAIVLSDTRVDEIMPAIVSGSLSFNGQRCTALKLHFVARPLADEFVTKLVAAVSDLSLGLPWEDGVQITPLAEGPDKISYLHELIADATSKGARVMNRGGGKADGNLFTPAVLYPVTADMRVFHEEQFGPLVPVAVMDDVEAVVQHMADSPVGQQVSIFGSNPETLASLAKRVSPLVGRVNLNEACKRGPDELPFSGHKSSALGTLSVTEALKCFSIETVIARSAS